MNFTSIIRLLLQSGMILLAIGLQAQKSFIINLKPNQHDFEGKELYVLQVIDKRPQKKLLGMVEKDGKMKPLHFKTPFEKHLRNAFLKIYPYHSKLVPVIAVVHHLRIIEYPPIQNANKQKGEIEWEVEFFHPDTLNSLLFVERSISYEALDVTKKHKDYVEELLKYSLLRANEMVQEKMVYQKIDTTFRPTLQLPLKKGLYDNFAEMLTKEVEKIPFTPIKADGKLERYYLKCLKRDRTKIRKGYMASDGEHLYLNIRVFLEEKAEEKPLTYIYSDLPTKGGHYLKSHFTGRYIYFEDRFTKGYLGYFFGVVGTLSGMRKAGVILDTRDGRLHLLTREFLKGVLDNYPEQKAAYNATKKDMEAKKEALRLHNEFLKEQLPLKSTN